VHAAISRAVQRNLASGFDDSFRRHLAVEQRRAVLDTIAHELTPETTLGDIVDAAQDLGWADGLGELCLSDLALALFGETPASAPSPAPVEHAADAETDEDEDEVAADDDDEVAADDDDEDEDDDEEEASDEDEEEAPSRGRKAEAERKPSSLDRALDRIDKALAARRKVRGKKTAKATPAKKAAAKKAASKKPAPPAKKAAPPPAKKTAAATRAANAAAAAAAAAAEDDEDDDTEAMSLDQAAKLLVPLVRKLREATMQDLEEQTKMGRRKLRFHIGQLVKHGRLRRHGMGRGTCYTVK
jgi:hypothetical protein